MAEDGALPDRDGMLRPADEHTVLQHRGVVAQRDGARSRAQDHALRQQSTGTEVRLPDQDGRGGDLGRGLLGPCPVETHPSASGRSIDQCCAAVARVLNPSRVMRMAIPARPCTLLLRRLFGQATGSNTVAGACDSLRIRVRRTVSSRHPWPSPTTATAHPAPWITA